MQQLLTDLRAHDVEIVTIGQYLRPSLKHHPLVRFWTPDEFAELKEFGLALGFQPRGERPAGAQLVPRPRTGGGGERGVSAGVLEYLWLGRVPYGDAWVLQGHLAAARARGDIGDVVLLVEHPPVYTMGRNGSPAHVPAAAPTTCAPWVPSTSTWTVAGSVTFHGPGQLVAYPILADRRCLPDGVRPRAGRRRSPTSARSRRRSSRRSAHTTSSPPGGRRTRGSGWASRSSRRSASSWHRVSPPTGRR